MKKRCEAWSECFAPFSVRQTSPFPSFLEQSESLAPDDFVEGIPDTYTIDGTLVGIPDSFTLRTVAGDRTLLGDDAGLTLERLLEIAQSNPEALPITIWKTTVNGQRRGGISDS